MSADAKQKMVGKDFIACGILSLLGMVGMLVAAVMNVSGYSAAFYPAAAAFFVSLVYVVVVCKVPKPGAILIYSVVPCVYFFTSGVIEGIIGSAGIAVFALAAEAIIAKDRTSGRRITLSGMVYTLYMSVVGMAENFLATDHYCDAAAGHGINLTVVEQMRAMYNFKPLWLVVIAATALLTLAGIQLGRRIMDKHLRKAGIVS